MLAGYLQVKTKQDAWQAYTAQMLWYLNSAAYKAIGAKFEHPTWMEMTNPKPRDERTGRQIIDDLVAKLRARQEKRKRERRE